MPRALIYARISVSDRKTPKVERQIADCRTLAAEHGYTIVDPPFQDDGISASAGKIRPGFEDLLKAVAAGEGDVVLATEEERFARSIGDKERLSIACLARGATWHTVRDGHVNPAQASGEFLSTLRAAMGKMESKRKAERQVAANAHRRASGERYQMGARIFGWKDDKVTLEPREADLIREGIRMTLDGATKYRVTEMFRSSGINPPRSDEWRGVAVASMLTRWSNAAVISYRDEAIEDGASGKWEAIVSRSELEAVRRVLARKGRGPNRASSLASGIARCGGCNEALVASGGTQKFYMCSAQRYGRKDHTVKHAAINQAILDDRISNSLIRSYLLHPEPNSVGSTELADLYEKLSKTERKQAALLDLHLDPDSNLSRSAYLQKNAELTRRTQSLIDAINHLATRSAHSALLVESRRKLFDPNNPLRREVPEPGANIFVASTRSFSVIRDIRQVWETLDLDEQRALIKDRLDVCVMPGRGSERIRVKRRTSNGVVPEIRVVAGPQS